MSAILIPTPDLQINFSYKLGQMRSLYLREALTQTIDSLKLTELDKQLAELVPPASLKALARQGLRGELLFAVPCILEANPYLLGYYRLLLGFSQKEFYTKAFGISGFKSMEARGVLTTKNRRDISPLSQALIHSAAALIEGIGPDRLSMTLLDDLALLTVGPQLRGGANVKKGVDGIVKVFQVIHDIVKHNVVDSNAQRMEIKNAAGRRVLIEFAPDPDIVIFEEMSPGTTRNVIAIEVKAGTDFSNIHNRVGEAEKSHQKAKNAGYVECWTVVNVDRIDMSMARRESPSSNRFFRLSDLSDKKGDDFTDFRNRIISLAGIRS